MAKPTLKASQSGIQRAKQALIDKKLKQQDLIGFVCNSRQPISKFFTGKFIYSDIFIGICEKLGLDWKEIADMPECNSPEADKQNQNKIDVLVQEIRDKIRADIQQSCGTMRVLDMDQPIGLDDIYTDVNILKKITGRRRLTINELKQAYNLDIEDFDRFGLGSITEKRVPGMEAVKNHQKLMMWGKPGSGKTTFLKYLAIHCICGDFQAKRVPIFITLKDFAETPNQPDLLAFIGQYFAKYEVTATEVAELLKHGRLLILLDGLDEVREEDSSRVLKQIQNFSDRFFFSNEFNEHFKIYSQEILKYYREKIDRSKKQVSPEEVLNFVRKEYPEICYTNSYVITCRIAAKEYSFTTFKEVEISDFDDSQIQTFVKKWFKLKDPLKSKRFIEKLKINKPIKELANSPLLLTLLCLVFEETANFPTNRSELYEEGIDILMKKWDAKRNIERDQVYKNLSLKRKEDLLSQIAMITFEQRKYLFKQKEAERYIADYIQNLPNAKTKPEALRLDSEAVLKSIEAQHGLLVERAKGIYSFSHLTFQEYFTARKIITTSEPQILESSLQSLATHITETRWREIFLLAIEMLPSANHLLQLMKKQIDALVIPDKKLQQFLIWVKEKSLSVQVSYKPAVVRCFYFSLILSYGNYNEFAKKLDSQIYSTEPYRAKADDFVFDEVLIELLEHKDNVHSRKENIELYIKNINYCLHSNLNPKLKKILEKYRMLIQNKKDIFSDLLVKELEKFKIREEFQKREELRKKTREEFIEELKIAEEFIEELRIKIIECRSIGHNWQFSNEQRKLLEQYFDVNNLLVDCLNKDCYVSREVRQNIEDTLFLPIV